MVKTEPFGNKIFVESKNMPILFKTKSGSFTKTIKTYWVYEGNLIKKLMRKYTKEDLKNMFNKVQVLKLSEVKEEIEKFEKKLSSYMDGTLEEYLYQEELKKLKQNLGVE